MDDHTLKTLGNQPTMDINSLSECSDKAVKGHIWTTCDLVIRSIGVRSIAYRLVVQLTTVKDFIILRYLNLQIKVNRTLLIHQSRKSFGTGDPGQFLPIKANSRVKSDGDREIKNDRSSRPGKRRPCASHQNSS